MIIEGIGLGVSGKFKVTVKRADGSIKTELPWQKNLITDKGIQCLLGQQTESNKSGRFFTKLDISENCVVGSSSTPPTEQDTTLGEFVASMTRREDYTAGMEDTTPTRPNHQRFWWRAKYIFVNKIQNKNITEVGLAFVNDGNPSDPEYNLFTHALIKDSHNSPTSITVLENETLELTYEFSSYVDITPKKGEFTLTKKNGESQETSTYQYMLRPHSLTKNLNAAGLYLICERSSKYAYGVDLEKETDLSANYDFDKWSVNTAEDGSVKYATVYPNTTQQFTLNDRQDQGYYITDNFSNWGYNKDYMYTPLSERSLTDGKSPSGIYTEGSATTIWVFSPYSWNFDNGIRAFEFQMGSTYDHGWTDKGWILLVVANKEDGTGLPKTSDDTLEIKFKITVTRYTGAE